MCNNWNIKIEKLETVDSTNEYAKKLIKEKKCTTPYVLVIADSQTAGKTTKKTTWFSPRGNLYMSLVLKIEDFMENFLPQLSFISALSLVEEIKSIRNEPINIQVKWPNDVLLDVMKLSGILIEKEENFAIIGIGVNVISHPQSDATVYPTIALKDREICVDKDDLGIRLSKRIIDNVKICTSLGFEYIIEKIKPFLIRLMEEIDFEQNGILYSGIFVDINKNGGLCLKTEDGTEKTFYSGNMYIYKKK